MGFITLIFYYFFLLFRLIKKKKIKQTNRGPPRSVGPAIQWWTSWTCRNWVHKKKNILIFFFFWKKCEALHLTFKTDALRVWNKRKGDGKCDCIPMLTCHCLLLGASPLDWVGFAFNSIYSNNLINYLYIMHCTWSWR